MTRSVGRTALPIVIAVLATTGCFKLARTSPQVERYVLGGARMAWADSTRSDSAGISLGLRRLELAPYLSTLAIVVRRADNEIVTSGFHRWAEGPGAGLNRAVSGYLAAAPGIHTVDVAPWPIQSAHDYVVQLHVARLEGVAPSDRRATRGAAHLVARWEILRPSDGAVLARGSTDHRAPEWIVGDYAGLVARLDEGLVVLTKELLACLAQLGRAAPSDSTVAVVAGRAPIACVARAVSQ